MRITYVGEGGESTVCGPAIPIFGLDYLPQQLHSFAEMTPLVEGWQQKIEDALLRIELAIDARVIITDSHPVPGLPPNFINIWITVNAQCDELKKLIPPEFLATTKRFAELQE